MLRAPARRQAPEINGHYAGGMINDVLPARF